MTPAAGARGLGNRLAPTRFLAFIALLPLAAALYRTLVPAASWADVAVIAFDVAALVFLGSLVPLLRDSTAAAMRGHARDNDANRVLVLLLTTVVTLVVMAALAGELRAARAGDLVAAARLVGSLLIVWAFSNAVFALHYAHAYYTADPAGGGDQRGIDFPGADTPDYFDFAYFAYTLGMTFQTSDVAITSPRLRRVALFHCFAAFIFNIGVIAFTINVLGGGGGG